MRRSDLTLGLTLESAPQLPLPVPGPLWLIPGEEGRPTFQPNALLKLLQEL